MTVCRRCESHHTSSWCKKKWDKDEYRRRRMLPVEWSGCCHSLAFSVVMMVPLR